MKQWTTKQQAAANKIKAVTDSMTAIDYRGITIVRNTRIANGRPGRYTVELPSSPSRRYCTIDAAHVAIDIFITRNTISYGVTK